MADNRFTYWEGFWDSMKYNDDETRLKKHDAMMRYAFEGKMPEDIHSEEYSFIQSIKVSLDKSKTYHMAQEERAGAGRRNKLDDEELTNAIRELKKRNEKLTMDAVLRELSSVGINVTRSTVEKREPWKNRDQIGEAIDWDSFSATDF